jgi:hypothetical protein
MRATQCHHGVRVAGEHRAVLGLISALIPITLLTDVYHRLGGPHDEHE